MNAWPEGWTENTNQAQRTSEPPLPPDLSPRRGAARAGGVPRQQSYASGSGGPGSGGSGYGGGGGGTPRPRVPGSRARKVKLALLGLTVVVLAWSVGTYFWADGKVRREVDLSKV